MLMVQSARLRAHRLSEEEREKFHAFRDVAAVENLKGESWLQETDLQRGRHIKVDKTGKALLSLLRHLGRLREVRAGGAASGQRVIVLCQPQREGGLAEGGGR